MTVRALYVHYRQTLVYNTTLQHLQILNNQVTIILRVQSEGKIKMPVSYELTLV